MSPPLSKSIHREAIQYEMQRQTINTCHIPDNSPQHFGNSKTQVKSDN
jgi:hypothetical protein